LIKKDLVFPQDKFLTTKPLIQIVGLEKLFLMKGNVIKRSSFGADGRADWQKYVTTKTIVF